MATQRATFTKDERLRSRKDIESLVRDGRSVTSPPLRLTWIPAPPGETTPARIAFSVPKKRLPLAVDRNRVRRRMREVFRKNKGRLYAFLKERSAGIRILLVFTGSKDATYPELEAQYHRILEQLEKRF